VIDEDGMSEAIVFQVVGEPQPQGSARARNVPGRSYPIIFTDNPKLKAWRREVAKAARLVHRGAPLGGPVRVVADFYLRRPKSLRHDRAHVTRPDTDKLLRGIGDSLTGVVIRDDSQVTQIKGSKSYAGVGETPRAVIAVTPLTEEGRLI
jgi:Holliday junction resolvase RusA-like endonuclease